MKELYQYRTASIEEVTLMLNLAKGEGWNPGLNDQLPFLVADPTGFFVGVLNGKIIATLAAVRYANQFGFIGLYIVNPEFRGQGYGFELWQHGMKYLSGYNIGLDAVISSQARYKKSGFHTAYQNIRFSGIIPKNNLSSSLVSVKQVPFDQLLSYDQQMFPANRAAFLSAWLSMSDSFGYAAVQKNVLRGYGVIRKCIEGYKIGPLFADDFKTAEQLLLTLAQHADQHKIFLDISEKNSDAIKLVEQFDMQAVFTTVRMYTKTQPSINLNKVYGITTFELG